MKKILEEGENVEKREIRKWLLEYSFYERFSDYWYNDIDDALTILMIYHCFDCGDLSHMENRVREQISGIIYMIFK
jgi:hypothetical protein